MDNSDAAKIVSLAVGLLLVVLLNSWLYPNSLADTVVRVLAAP
jgi:hypothetical protein